MKPMKTVVVGDNEKTQVKIEVKLNRWKRQFGIESDNKQKFVDYLIRRFWLVRGTLVDTAHGDHKNASAAYVKSLIEESQYWDIKSEVNDVYSSIIEQARVADDYSYKPVHEQTISDDNSEQVMFNTYRAPLSSRKIPTQSEIMLWEAFWLHLLKNEDERKQVQQWVASLALHPEKRTGIAILLHGTSTGTGKGTLGEVLTELVGRENTAKPMNAVQSLTGRFNAGLEGKVLFIVDELYEGGSFKLANGIKGKITEPTLEVEPKGEEMRKINNYCNFYATSNHLTPLWLDDKDRRWEVYSIEYDEHTKDKHQVAIRAFRKWFEEDKAHAIAVIRELLMAVDLASYQPWMDGAKDTEAKRKLISNSVSSQEDDFEVHWNQREFDEKMVVNMTEVFADEGRRISTGQRTSILTNLGCKKLDNRGNVKINGIQSRNWWITPKGLSVGISVNMNGREIGDILSTSHPDVTEVTYNEESETLVVSTKTQF
jgi:hypothetical protein